MGVWSELLGPKIVTASGEIDADTLSSCKAVALYFSAHWCPPCRGFTPKLAEMYKNTFKAKGMEVVFVSSDRDEDAFKEYFAEMPWASLPYSDRARKDALSKKYKVQGIPSLVILDGGAKTITMKGREAVMGDPQGNKFPWIPRTLKEMLNSAKYLSSADQPDSKIGFESFDGKKIGLYFSAHWCPPCRGFTPKFAETYKKLVDEKKEKFDVIFVSSDRSPEDFSSYFKEMPWKALPFEERDLKSELSSYFDVEGIPSLVILDENREVVNANAVGKVRADPEGANFPYLPELVNEIDDEPDGINETPSLILWYEKCSAEDQQKYKSILVSLAEKYKQKSKESGEDMQFIFFCASKEGELADRLRGMCSVTREKTEVSCVLVDIPDNGGFYEGPSVVSQASLETFISEYEAKKLERKQLGRPS